MAYVMNDSGTYLQFTCSFEGHWWEKSRIIAGLFSLIMFTTIIILILFWPGSIYTGGVWPIVWISLFLLFLLVEIEHLIVELFWQFAGKEVMEISQDGIVVRHQIFGLGILRRYRIDKLSSVFVTRYKVDYDWFDIFIIYPPFSICWFKYGKVAFNYGCCWLVGGPNTFRFGTGLGWKEATQIVSIIYNRFPQYQFKQSKPVP
jgi:hypothetical protein